MGCFRRDVMPKMRVMEIDGDDSVMLELRR